MKKNISLAILCMVSTLGLFACGSSSSDQTPSTTTYSMSGTVTSLGVGLQDVAMTLNSSTTATTDASGNYTFTGLANGSYTLTQSKAGYTFNPINSSQTMNSANITGINFTAAATGVTGLWTVTNVDSQGGGGTFSMTLTQIGSSVSGTTLLVSYSGTVSGSVSGTSISLTGADPQPTCSGSVGTYTGTVNGNTMSGSYTSTAGGTCGVESGTWTATRTYSISGAVTSSGTALQGVTMTQSGASAATATTDASGNYSFTGLANGSYTITPSKSGYAFNPTSSAQTVNGTNITGINFVATSTTLTSGTVTGTVTYTGSLGTVSASKPIIVYMNPFPDQFDGFVANLTTYQTTTLTTSPSTFTFNNVPGGQYHLVAIFDRDSNGVTNGDLSHIYTPSYAVGSNCHEDSATSFTVTAGQTYSLSPNLSFDDSMWAGGPAHPVASGCQ